MSTFKNCKFYTNFINAWTIGLVGGVCGSRGIYDEVSYGQHVGVAIGQNLLSMSEWSGSKLLHRRAIYVVVNFPQLLMLLPTCGMAVTAL